MSGGLRPPSSSGGRTPTRAERAYPKLIYFNEVPRGNHFAAWQVPQLSTEEVRAGLRSLR